MQITHTLPELGDRRLRSGFLFLPMRIGNRTRVWERAAWIEEYQVIPGFARIASGRLCSGRMTPTTSTPR